jgi:DNA mismatch repair protein MutL
MNASDIIQLLPDSIANQIAAGEVVQRPASVVKELLENSIDAKATSIQVIIREAGKNLIQIIDNGIGMSETDARMSFERHATSKIRKSEDLFSIRTMGFRGEALASIAAVAQVELRTRREQDEVGVMIRIEGSSITAQEAIAIPVGTNFQVKNLFFNVPARRNFLKTNSVEMKHLLDEFQRIALAHPEVGLSLHHNDVEIYNLAPAKLVKRIVDMFGKNYREQLAYCQEETSYINIKGYIGKPEFARKTRGEQFFFVNERFIKHNYLHHAVVSAFEGTLPEGSHPFYVLHIEIDPSHIDINIHPTKTEIKFDDERSVYAIIMASVRKAIGIYNMAPSIDFEDNTNFLYPPQQSFSKSPVEPLRGISSSNWAPKSDDPADRKPGNLTNWSKLYEGMRSSGEAEQSAFELDFPREEPKPEPQSMTIASKANLMSKVPVATQDESLLFQLHNRYILTQIQDGLILIDQKAAYERILFERYKLMLTKRNGACQQLLFPKTINMSPAEIQLVIETSEEIRSLGFEFDQIGPAQLVVRGIPAGLPDEREEDLFEDLVEQIKQSYADLKINRTESLSRSLARRFSSRYVTKLSLLEMHTLIEQLFASSDPNRTPGGDPIITRLTQERLASLF